MTDTLNWRETLTTSFRDTQQRRGLYRLDAKYRKRGRHRYYELIWADSMNDRRGIVRTGSSLVLLQAIQEIGEVLDALKELRLTHLPA